MSGTPPHCTSLRNINHPYLCIDHFLSSSVDVPKANSNLGIVRKGQCCHHSQKASWSQLEFITTGPEQKLLVKSGVGVERLQGNFWRRSRESCGKWNFSQLGCLENCNGSSCWDPKSSIVRGEWAALYFIFASKLTLANV